MLKRIFLIGSLVTAITSGMLFTPSTAEAQRWRARVWAPYTYVDTSWSTPSSYYTYPSYSTSYPTYYDPNAYYYTSPTYTTPTYTTPTYTTPTYTTPTYTYPTYYYDTWWDRYPYRPRWR